MRSAHDDQLCMHVLICCCVFRELLEVMVYRGRTGSRYVTPFTCSSVSDIPLISDTDSVFSLFRVLMVRSDRKER